MSERVAALREDFAEEARLTARMLVAAEAVDPGTHCGGRSVQDLCVHLIVSPGRILAFTGLDPEEALPRDLEPPLASPVAAYRAMYATFDRLLADGLTEARLEEVVTVYDQAWTRARTLDIVLRHEIHHRAQLGVLLRHAGALVPATYGPSADDR